MEAKAASMRAAREPGGSTYLFAAAGLAVAILFGTDLSAQEKPAAADSGNICLQTANAVLASCKSAAQSDYEAAVAKCINITEIVREGSRRGLGP